MLSCNVGNRRITCNSLSRRRFRECGTVSPGRKRGERERRSDHVNNFVRIIMRSLITQPLVKLQRIA